jgi:hypothetical protein
VESIVGRTGQVHPVQGGHRFEEAAHRLALHHFQALPLDGPQPFQGVLKVVTIEKAFHL